MSSYLQTDLPVEIVELEDEQATALLARWCAGFARPGDFLVLSGELGAGKTAFARAFPAQDDSRIRDLQTARNLVASLEQQHRATKAV